MKLKRPRIHTSNSFFKDMSRFFGWIRRPKKNGRLSKIMAKIGQELRRE